MHIIGIAGGGTVLSLGTAQEIQLFFDCREAMIFAKDFQQGF